MVEISKSGSGEGLGGVIPRGYSKRPAGGGGRERLNSEAITEAIRPFNPQGAFGARHWHTR